MLLLHDALYTPGVQCSLVSFVLLIQIGFSFCFRPNGVEIFHNGNLFVHVTLKGDFIILDLDDNYYNTSSIFVSYFDSDSKFIK